MAYMTSAGNFRSIKIKSSDDLNDFKGFGIYVCESPEISATLLHCPLTNQKFILECYQISDDSTFQTIRGSLTSYFAQRVCEGNSWSDWEQIKGAIAVSVLEENGLSMSDSGKISMSLATNVNPGTVIVTPANGLTITAGKVAMSAATSTSAGTVIVDTSYGLTITNGRLNINQASDSQFGTVRVSKTNGLTISNGQISIAAAAAAAAGTVTTGVQTFGGAKTFAAATTFSSSITVAGNATFNGVMYPRISTSYTTYEARRIGFSTDVPTSLSNGTVCLVYQA